MLTASAGALGPRLTGLLAPFPLYAAVLTVFAHAFDGGDAAASVLRGLLLGLFAFAATLPARLDPQFDVLFDATLGDETVDAFLRSANPAAREAMAARFDEAIRRGLWRPRRNSVARITEKAS